MSDKITFPDLAALLALRTGKTKRVSEEFLKEFFEQIAGALEAGDNVRIKGFGTFKVSRVEARKSVNVTTGQEFEIPAHNRISFVAAKELAAAVNAPFEMFEAVELADGLSETELDKDPEDVAASAREVGPEARTIEDEADAASGSEAEMEVEEMENEIEEEESLDSEFPQPIVVSETVNSETDKEETIFEESAPIDAKPDPEPEPAPRSAPQSEAEESAHVAESHVVVKETPEVMPGRVGQETDLRPNRKKMIWVFVAGFVAAALIAVIAGLSIAYFSLSKRMEQAMEPKTAHARAVDILEQEKDMTENETVPEAEALAEASRDIREKSAQPVEAVKPEAPAPKEEVAKTRPSDSFSYDRISNTRFLTTMAKHYYGNYEFWPYIYEANPNLGHPDRIKPGTRIRIPPLSSIGADPSNPTDIAAAKRKGAAIYARYNTPMTSSRYKPAKKK